MTLFPDTPEKAPALLELLLLPLLLLLLLLLLLISSFFATPSAGTYGISDVRSSPSTNG